MSNSSSIPGDLPRPKRRRARIVLLGLLILFCGMVIGAGTTLSLLRTGLLFKILPRPSVSTEHILAKLDRQLDLDDEQSRRIREIIGRHQDVVKAWRAEFTPRIMAELDRFKDDVSAVLTPEQAAKWEKEFKKIRRFWVPGRRDFRPPKPE